MIDDGKVPRGGFSDGVSPMTKTRRARRCAIYSV